MGTVVYVVCQHADDAPSTTVSWTVIGRIRGSAGVSSSAPLAVACTFARPGAPALSVSATMPSGLPALFRYTKPVAIARQHGRVPHVPPGKTSAPSSGWAFADPS